MKKIKILFNIALVGIALCFLAGIGQASTLLTSDVGYTGPTLDLTAYANDYYHFTFGPESLPGGITFTSSPGGSGGYQYGGNSGKGSVFGYGEYGLGGNGNFGGSSPGIVYVGLDSGTGDMTFSFSSAASEFGLYVNYAPGVGNNPIIATLDNLGYVITSFDLSVSAPISTPGGLNQYLFRGIDESSNVIWGFRLGGSYIIAAATETGAPNNQVPEPTTMLLLGSGLLGLAGYGRKKFFKK